MTTLVESARRGNIVVCLAGASILGLLIAAAVIPNLSRSRDAADRARVTAPQRALTSESPISTNWVVKTKPTALAGADQPAELQIAGALAGRDSASGRKIIRTSTVEMVVEHPAESADRITAMAEQLGGYVVSADSGGQNATAARLTVRVPAARFDEARAEIRKMGLRVENEKIGAEDVTRQYVDQDAILRNLGAEEAQYLTILKQARTVKDMLTVSEKLSEVHGQIEQQQAEFNALSQQIETVVISISLRTEAEAQVFGLNWRPGYELKMALRDGLESLATYASAMTTILFYLPATLLWVGTILLVGAAGWRLTRWIGRRWFGWKFAGSIVQG